MYHVWDEKLLLGLLMLIMLTPSLACAMTVCPMQKVKGSDMSCHQSGENGAPMLVLDCMGLDLFQQDVNNDFQPDQSIEKIDYVWADLFNNTGFESNSRTIFVGHLNGWTHHD